MGLNEWMNGWRRMDQKTTIQEDNQQETHFHITTAANPNREHDDEDDDQEVLNGGLFRWKTKDKSDSKG